VAFIAMLDQEGPDVPFEELTAILAWWRGGHRPRCSGGQDHDEDSDDSSRHLAPGTPWFPAVCQPTERERCRGHESVPAEPGSKTPVLTLPAKPESISTEARREMKNSESASPRILRTSAVPVSAW